MTPLFTRNSRQKQGCDHRVLQCLPVHNRSLQPSRGQASPHSPGLSLPPLEPKSLLDPKRRAHPTSRCTGQPSWKSAQLLPSELCPIQSGLRCCAGGGLRYMMRSGGEELMSGLKLMLGVRWSQPGEGEAQVTRGMKDHGPTPFISVSCHLMRRALNHRELFCSWWHFHVF